MKWVDLLGNLFKGTAGAIEAVDAEQTIPAPNIAIGGNMSSFTVTWNDLEYPDGTPVQGEVVHVEARLEGGIFAEVAESQPDDSKVSFEFDVAEGETIEVRAQAEVAGDLGPFSNVVSLTRPRSVPALQGVALVADSW